MKTIYDIQQFLKKFGTFIYIGDRVADLELMEAEVREIYRSQMMDTKDYQMAILLLRQEIGREKKRKDS
ncbi:YqgQ family protein [Peribacillus asahii]|uniref:YqgQ family protein n=1 Tax=Peribacillus asahii TaxID=228899 RepID=UPI0037F2C162